MINKSFLIFRRSESIVKIVYVQVLLRVVDYANKSPKQNWKDLEEIQTRLGVKVYLGETLRDLETIAAENEAHWRVLQMQSSIAWPSWCHDVARHFDFVRILTK